jgi:sulfopyruvate decarboxylase
MLEDRISSLLKKEGISYVISLPCDRTKNLCALLEEKFRYIGISREEDGIGILSGLSLTGKKGILQMQSSGLGNSLNALMTLPYLYELPLLILASWRGYYQESIPAQFPFNEKIPDLLKLYNIPYIIIDEPDEIEKIAYFIQDTWRSNRPHIVLLSPKIWDNKEEYTCTQPGPRERNVKLNYSGVFRSPIMTRSAAIEVLSNLFTDELVISNIGVPSKELYYHSDRAGNFYMLGSYTQATPVGLGIALGTDRKVIVIDGDGSLLGTAVLPTVAGVSPENLIIIGLDNGVYGSIGNQASPAWNVVDLELLAKASGIMRTYKVHTPDELIEAYTMDSEHGPVFIHVVIKSGNTRVPNIPLSPQFIRDRFSKEILMHL